MPNFTPKGWQPWNDRVMHGISWLLMRRIQDANRRIPVTVQDIQNMVVPPETLSLIEELEVNHKVENLPVYSEVAVRIPGLDEDRASVGRRGARFDIKLNPGIRLRTIGKTIDLDLDQYPKDKTLLYDWYHKAKAELDNCSLAEQTVKEFLGQHESLSLWHVTTRWPTLKLGYDADTKERAATLPRSSRKYGWASADAGMYAWWTAQRQRMAEIDEMLLIASMLPVPDTRYSPDPGQFRVTLRK